MITKTDGTMEMTTQEKNLSNLDFAFKKYIAIEKAKLALADYILSNVFYHCDGRYCWHTDNKFHREKFTLLISEINELEGK